MKTFSQSYKVTIYSSSLNSTETSLRKFLIDRDGVTELQEDPNYSCYVLLIEPSRESPWLGFFDGEEVELQPQRSRYFACPNPDFLAVSAGWGLFLGCANNPKSFDLVAPYPIDRVWEFPENEVLLVTGDQDLSCINFTGLAWTTEDLVMSEIFIAECSPSKVIGYENRAEKDFRFELDIHTGKVISGGLSRKTIASKSLSNNRGNLMQRFTGKAFPIICFFVPILFFAISYLVRPGYYSPLFANALGLCFVAGMLVWDGIGLAIGLVSQSIVVRILSILFFTLPVIFCSALLPAVFTIVQAISPIMSGPR